MNYASTNFQKIFLKSFITTELNEHGEEKKNLLKLLPKGWNSEKKGEEEEEKKIPVPLLNIYMKYIYEYMNN